MKRGGEQASCCRKKSRECTLKSTKFLALILRLSVLDLIASSFSCFAFFSFLFFLSCHSSSETSLLKCGGDSTDLLALRLRKHKHTHTHTHTISPTNARDPRKQENRKTNDDYLPPSPPFFFSLFLLSAYACVIVCMRTLDEKNSSSSKQE